MFFEVPGFKGALARLFVVNYSYYCSLHQKWEQIKKSLASAILKESLTVGVSFLKAGIESDFITPFIIKPTCPEKIRVPQVGKHISSPLTSSSFSFVDVN